MIVYIKEGGLNVFVQNLFSSFSDTTDVSIKCSISRILYLRSFVVYPSIILVSVLGEKVTEFGRWKSLDYLTTPITFVMERLFCFVLKDRSFTVVQNKTLFGDVFEIRI